MKLFVVVLWCLIMAYNPLPNPQPGTYSDPSFDPKLTHTKDFGGTLKAIILDGNVIHPIVLDNVATLALHNLANRDQNRKLKKH